MTNGHCHRIVKLSGTLPRVGNDDAEIIQNVHGVRDDFLEIGSLRAVTHPYSSTSDSRLSDPLAEPSNRGRRARISSASSCGRKVSGNWLSY